MASSVEDVAKIVKVSIIEAIGETKTKLESVPWNKKGQIKDESFSRKIEEKIKEKLPGLLPELKFFTGGMWSNEKYSVVAYTPHLLILVQAIWVLRQEEVGLRQVNSLETRLTKTVRRAGGRSILVFLASNRFVRTNAFAKFMRLQQSIDQGIMHVEVVNSSSRTSVP